MVIPKKKKLVATPDERSYSRSPIVVVLINIQSRLHNTLARVVSSIVSRSTNPGDDECNDKKLVRRDQYDDRTEQPAKGENTGAHADLG